MKIIDGEDQSEGRFVVEIQSTTESYNKNKESIIARRIRISGLNRKMNERLGMKGVRWMARKYFC